MADFAVHAKRLQQLTDPKLRAQMAMSADRDDARFLGDYLRPSGIETLMLWYGTAAPTSPRAARTVRPAASLCE